MEIYLDLYQLYPTSALREKKLPKLQLHFGIVFLKLTLYYVQFSSCSIQCLHYCRYLLVIAEMILYIVPKSIVRRKYVATSWLFSNKWTNIFSYLQSFIVQLQEYVPFHCYYYKDYCVCTIGIKKKFENWLKYFWCSLFFTQRILIMTLYSIFDFTNSHLITK